jgi:hypothetical protein
MMNRKKYLWFLGVILLLCIIGLFSLSFFNFANFQPFATSCLDWNDIDPNEEVIIEKESLDILKLLASGQANKVWDNSHPTLQSEVTKEQFEASIRELSNLLTGVDKAKLSDGRLITLYSTNTAKTNVVCGLLDTNSPTHLGVQTLVGGNKFAIAQVNLPAEPFGRVASIQMAEDEGNFKLVTLEIQIHDYKGKNAEYYEKLGDKWADQKKLLEAYLAYQFGAELSNLGSFLQTGQNIRLNNKAQEVVTDKILQDAVKSWNVDDKDYRIINVALLATLGDINMYVKYLSYEDLDPTGTKKEAMMLMKYIEQEYPDLGTEFDGVVLEAFNVLPTDPNKAYSTYRVPINFVR